MIAVSHRNEKVAVRAEAGVVDGDGEGQGDYDRHGRQAEDLDGLVVVAEKKPELPRVVFPYVQSVVHVPSHVILADGGPLGQ